MHHLEDNHIDGCRKEILILILPTNYLYNIMKKFFVVIMALTLSCAYAHAQKMSDEQIIEYVTEARAKGDSDQDIAKQLLRRGVTMDQVNRLKKQYERAQGTGQGQTLSEVSRTRIAPLNPNRVSLESDARNLQNMKQADKEDMMLEGIDFLLPDSLSMLVQEELEKQRRQIFGHSIFQNKEVSFEAAYNLPTPDNYRLGPGDEVLIDIWGASQSTLQQTISPDGCIQVENLGPVYLSGLTVKQANARLRDQFGRMYSSLNGDNPESQIRLTLGQNRTISVHVLGEVESPGTYEMSSFATIFNALYMAGGVTDHGTLRDVKVFRDNKEIASFDIYDFILNGHMGKEVRLEDNDVVNVGTYQNLVCVSGQVKRPMFYEMLSTESVKTLLGYAGGLTGNAYRKDVRLIRVGEREYEIYTLDEQEQQSFCIADGDSVSVDSIMPTFANKVEVRGAVYRPGEFQMDGRVSTVRQLIQTAGGLRDDAYRNRAILNRRNADGTMENQTVNLGLLMEGHTDDIRLRKNDILVIPSIDEMRETQVVTIYGEVAFPGAYHYQDNMTIEDFIVMAGGLNEAASTAKVDVSRRIKDSRAVTTSDTISHTYSFAISDGLLVDGQSNFVLKPFDEVYIRKSPGYYEQENVKIQGEVVFSGTYALTKKSQRLSELVESAGGLTPQAYVKGARLQRQMTDEEIMRLETNVEIAIQALENKRDSVAVRRQMMNQTEYPVGIELEKALANPGSDADLVLRAGDVLTIPQFSNTVKMSGEVARENTVSYKKGRTLRYYINQAGGYSDKAKRSNAYVVYMNGTVTKANSLSSRLIQPGCEIVVPEKDDKKGMTTAEILSLGSTAASLATVVLALTNLIAK